MNALQFAEQYSPAIVRSGYIQRRVIKRFTENKLPVQEALDLAKAAIWLSVRANPKAPKTAVLKHAKRLYSKWLREDYLPLFASLLRERRNGQSYYLEPETAYWPADRAELADEVYNCLDLVLRNCGVHVGLWAILSFALQDSYAKAQTIFQHMGFKPTKRQREQASLIVTKIKEILPK